MTIKSKLEIMYDLRSVAERMDEANKRAQRLRGLDLDSTDAESDFPAELEKGSDFTQPREP